MDDGWELLLATTFWVALLFLFYTYLGYPLMLWVRRLYKRRPTCKRRCVTPPVSIVIVAYNEAAVIRRKLENMLHVEYPKDRLEIMVVSDGSNDQTNAIVRSFKNQGVTLLEMPIRKGKASALNHAIGRCQGEIVVLSDSRQLYDPSAIRELVANFDDPSVGLVTGDVRFRPGPENRDGEQIGFYWKYEMWIRLLQSEADSTPVVSGAISAIRKSLYRPLPAGIIGDDLAVPMNVIMQGFRVLFDPAAIAYDQFPKTLGIEFRKRIRTIAGSYQYLMLVPQALNPFANRVWFDFVSHKVARVLAPIAIIMLLITNIFLAGTAYRAFLVAQSLFYALAVAGAILVSRGVAVRALALPYTFLLLNAAACVAFIKVALGMQTNLWEKH